MRTSLQTFRAGIDELLAFLTSTEREEELVRLLLIASPSQELKDQEKILLSQVASAHTARKRYIYAVAIVSLYGILERYLDSLIDAFVIRLASLSGSYQMMPLSIQNNHLPLSVELMKAIAEDKHRKNITQEEVISNLHSCLSGVANFRVNGSAFVLHRGNISLSKITKYLSDVGIDAHLRKVTLAQSMIDFFAETQPETPIRDIADAELLRLLKPIDDLVHQRNQVSHGVISVDDIESVELSKERCQFVGAYGAALYDVLAHEVLKYEVKKPYSQKLGRPIAVHNNSIVCFESSNCTVSVGDILAADTGDSLITFRHGAISSLQVNNVPYDRLIISEMTKFGAVVPYIAKPSYEYYLLPGDLV